MKKITRRNFLKASGLTIAAAGFAACAGEKASSASQSAGAQTGGDSNEPAADVIKILVPPISGTYQDQIATWSAEFNKMYPHLTLEFETGSWEDYTNKLDVQVNAAAPPDIAQLAYGAIGKYLDTGLLVNVDDYATEEMIAAFDESALAYFQMEGGQYGLPSYNVIQALGGNREMLIEAGADIEKIQSSGWTFEEFKEIIAKGTTDDRYGFVFANSGVAAGDLLSIFAISAGMPGDFDDDLKYMYTSKNFLQMLTDVSGLIASGYMPDTGVDAGQRWNMFLTGKTMIFGKGMALFEGSAILNNESIESNDGKAVENSIITDYVVLPVPIFYGEKQGVMGSVDGFGMFRGKETTDEHLKNVAMALYYMTTNTPAAHACNELYLAGLNEPVRELLGQIENEHPRDPGNLIATEYMVSNSVPPNANVTAELATEAVKLRDAVMIPKFQALIAQEITPQEMYDAVYKAAVNAFGEDGIVKN